MQKSLSHMKKNVRNKLLSRLLRIRFPTYYLVFISYVHLSVKVFNTYSTL